MLMPCCPYATTSRDANASSVYSYKLSYLCDSEPVEVGTIADGVPGGGGHEPQHLPHLRRWLYHELHGPRHGDELDIGRDVGEQRRTERIHVRYVRIVSAIGRSVVRQRILQTDIATHSEIFFRFDNNYF